ncbi:hypothetical protein OS493_031932 [Desmophyllum pertusum]|uniref:G-protein coupled receptors family 1 profile domain-containing protein n=1 Tax=Desmophyllum pertusum TaxID=174260 RepID=A0A9W9ZWY2_9CNID|nr:hypothetical protein OS493_031932 [Desmophyllum pertusum]
MVMLLNVLVIMAVIRRPMLQTNTNILLACLAVTDAMTGLTTQPLFISWKTFQLIDLKNFINPFRGVNFTMRALTVCSCLHLMLVTCERLIAIKFTMHYHEIVTKEKFKVAVISCWVYSVTSEILRRFNSTIMIADLLVALVLICCIIFITSAYLVLYVETRRHQKMIKTQQLPQEEEERFVKESKALKTTVYVIGAVVLCYLPMAFVLFSYAMKWQVSPFLKPFVRTFAMLNSFLNPLIYCWRQKEMRKFVFRIRTTQPVHPAN